MKEKKVLPKILFLKDDTLMIRRVEKILQETLHEFELKVAKTEKEFFKFIIRFDPDVILSGYQLEKYSANEAYELLQTEHFNIPFIIVTDKLDKESVNELIRKGIEDCVFTSNLSQLSVSVLKALEKKKINIQKDHVEHQLKHEQGRLATIFINTPEAIINIGFKGEILEINPTGLQMLQVDVLKKLTNKNIFDFIHPEDKKLFKKFHNSVGIGNKKIEKFRIVGSKKEEYWVESSAIPLLDEEQHVVSVLTINRDITKRIHSEAVLLESQMRLKAGQEIANIGYWDHDFVTGNRTWSKQMFKIFERRESNTAPAFETFLNDVHPDDRESVLNVKEKLSNTNDRVMHRYRLLLDDGNKTKHILAFSQALRNEKGVAYKLVGTTMDVTELFTAKEKALISEQKFQELFDSSPDGIYVEDENGFILDVNRTACDFQGFTKEELVGKNVLELIPDNLKSKVSINHKRLFDQEDSVRESFTWDRNWKERPVEIKTSRIHFDGKPAMLLHVRDISKRIAAEKAKRETELKFDVLSDQVPVGIYQVDSCGNFVLGNKKLLEIFELTLEELKAGEWESRIHPDDMPRFMKLRDQTKGTSKELEINYKLLISDKIKYVFGKSNALYDESGAVTGRIGTILDLTENRQSMQQMMFTQTMFQNIFEHSPDPIFIEDFDGTILNANLKACKMHGFEYDELIGKNIMDMVPESYRETMQRNHKQFCEGTLERIKVSSWTKEGKELPVEIKANLINYFNKVALLLHVTAL